MTLNELRDFIGQQAEIFHSSDNDSDWQWEMVESSTFKKIFDFIVDNAYFNPSKKFHEVDDEWDFISAMEVIYEDKEKMPLEVKEMIDFFYQSFYPENKD